MDWNYRGGRLVGCDHSAKSAPVTVGHLRWKLGGEAVFGVRNGWEEPICVRAYW